MGKLFVMLFADTVPLTGTGNQSGTRIRSAARNKNSAPGQISDFDQTCTAMLHHCLLPTSSTGTITRPPIKFVPRSLQQPIKFGP